MKTKLHLLLCFITFLGYSQTDIEQLHSPNASQFAIVTGTIDQSASGANTSWDFTSLSTTATVLTDTYVDTPPTSTIETANGSTITSTIDLNTNGGVVSVTSALSSGVQLNYTDPALIGAFPLSFGYTSTDDVEGTFSGPISGDVLDTSSIDVSVDAWGNLKVGTFDGEVTRLKIIQNLNLSALGGLVTPTGTQTSYFYYDANSNNLIFRTTRLQIPYAGIDDSGMDILLSHTLSNKEFLETQVNVELLENPVKNILEFKVSDFVNVSDITILDVTGKLVIKSNTNALSVNVNHLKPGLFFAFIKTDIGVITKKFVKL